MKIGQLITSLLMLSVIATPGFSTELGSLPPPSVLVTFEKTMASVKTLSVLITVSEDDSKIDKAQLILVKPNKLWIQAVSDKNREVLISDGHYLKQWDKKYYYKDNAAPTLAGLNEMMDFDSLAGEMGEDVFTTPNDFAVIPEFTDIGQRNYDGDTVDVLTAANFHGTKILSVDSATGLPLEYDYIRKHGGFTVYFNHYKINKSVSPFLFAESAPDGRKKYIEPKSPPLLANGTMAPDFKLKTVAGQPVTLSSYRGKIVIVDFWASWCPPCKMSMPHVQAVYNDLKGQGLNVLSVNTWDSAPFAEAFLAKHPWYNTTFLIDSDIKKSIASTKYKVYGIPTLYIIDKTGKIADSYVDYDPNEEKAIRADLAKLGISKD